MNRLFDKISVNDALLEVEELLQDDNVIHNDAALVNHASALFEVLKTAERKGFTDVHVNLDTLQVNGWEHPTYGHVAGRMPKTYKKGRRKRQVRIASMVDKTSQDTFGRFYDVVSHVDVRGSINTEYPARVSRVDGHTFTEDDVVNIYAFVDHTEESLPKGMSLQAWQVRPGSGEAIIDLEVDSDLSADGRTERYD